VDPSGEFITWSIGKNGLSIGFNLTPIGIPIGAGINMGWSNGASAGIYVEFGPRIGGTGLGSGFTQQYSLDYNFKHGSWSTTTSVGAYASVGPFTAGGNFSITHNLSNNDFPTASWGVYAGIGIGGEKGSLGFTVGYGSAGWSYGIGGSYYTAYERAYMRAEMRNRRNINDAFSYERYLGLPQSPGSGGIPNGNNNCGNNLYIMFPNRSQAERYLNSYSNCDKEKFFYITKDKTVLVGPWNDATNVTVSPRYLDRFDNGFVTDNYGVKWQVEYFVHTHPSYSSPIPSGRDAAVYKYFNHWGISTLIYYNNHYYYHTSEPVGLTIP